MVMKEWILVTGGAGYVGSHCVTQILQSGHHVVILDCLSNSSLGQSGGNQSRKDIKINEISAPYLILPPTPRLNGNFTFLKIFSTAFPPGLETSLIFFFSTLMASLSYCFSPFHSIFRCGQQVGGADWEKHSSSQC